MSQTTLSIRMDENLKRQFDSLCYDFGMNVSTAITIFAKTIVRERRFPIEITASADPFYSEANQARIRESIAQLEAGLGVVHELIEVDDD